MITWLREFWRQFALSFMVAFQAAERGADFDTARKLGQRARPQDPPERQG